MRITKKMKKVAWGKVVDLIVQIVDVGPARNVLIKKAESSLYHR